MLPFMMPMRAKRGHEAFDDEDYIFEPGWDGQRLLLYKNGQKLEAFTRTGRNVTFQYPELLTAAGSIDLSEAVLDAEGVCLRQGRPVFDDAAYRGRLSKQTRIEQALTTHPITFIVLDLLYADRRAQLQEPLSVRKHRLMEHVGKTDAIAPTLYVEQQGIALYQLTREQRLEGIVAKRKDGFYYPGQLSPDWQKLNHLRSIDVMVLGYRTEPEFALVIGLHFRTIRSKPVGTVSEGISREQREVFLQLAPRLHTKQEAKVQWLEPLLCCRIEYGDRDERHQLRHTVFKDWLPDKKSDDCVWPYT